MEQELLLKVQDLTVEFHRPDSPPNKAVDKISLNLEKGEAVCLVGESGCGKTVTGLCIMGLLPKNQKVSVTGQIIFKNLDLLTLKEDQLRLLRGKEISMIFQEPMTSLNPVLTIGEQLKELFQAHPETVRRKYRGKEIHDMCIELLNKVQLPDPKERLRSYPHMLSGGQRQRIMIAMAVALRPSLIIADEPTTALDVTLQIQILTLLKELQEQNKSSLLFITHDLSIVSIVARRVYVMYKGSIMEEGFTKDILSSPMHPYTQALLNAIPDPQKRGKKIALLKTTEQEYANSSGCKYISVCPLKTKECNIESIPLIESSGRKVRCCRYAS